jgi:GntR family transcriptional regulator/MocR family aminotransferase
LIQGQFNARIEGQIDLHLHLDATQGSLKARFEHALRDAVRVLPPGARLPPTRALAAELGVSRGVAVEAYAQLAAEGYLVTRRGGGTFVAHTATTPAAPAATPRAQVRPPRFDLRPALPALDGAFRPAWARALNRVLRTTPDARLGYPDPRGEPELRSALAESLARRRGVQAGADDVRITGGLGPSLPFLWRLLRARGIRRVAIERPCWPRLDATLRDAGLEPVPLAVDEHGLRVDGLAGVGAAFVTPAHQYPTGAVLSPERRAALIRWARAAGAIVVEDDYDAEFRYDRQPVGSLQGLAPDVVAYGGSTSKTLAPGLRLGWLVLPPQLRAEPPGTPPVLDQLALADLLVRGDFDRHLRRHRRLYRRRREALLHAVATQLPELRVSGAAAGLHAVLHVPGAEAVAVRARAHGVALEAAGGTLVVGYANLPEAQAAAAVTALSHAVRVK